MKNKLGSYKSSPKRVLTKKRTVAGLNSQRLSGHLKTPNKIIASTTLGRAIRATNS